jgi:large subunit ribosomal protein L13
LIGKDKRPFTPYLDSGEHVIVINRTRFAMTGNKSTKIYTRTAATQGGLKEVPAQRAARYQAIMGVRERSSDMPKNKLRAPAKKLRVYRAAAGLARAHMGGAEAAASRKF